MSNMTARYELGIADYIVIFLTLLISMGIGIKMRFSGSGQKTTDEYLMAGKNMGMFPVIISICVTAISAAGMLGSASEVYKYGTQQMIGPVAVPLGLILAAYVVVPVYFQCNVTTIYELLEIRYGAVTRRVVSVLFIIQVVLYQSVVMYVPVLALGSVTNLSFELSIIVFGAVCTIYSSVGGLKGVLWTDVFQFFLMLAFVLILSITAGIEIGGFDNFYSRVNNSNRLEFFNFSIDFTKRYTFWSSFFYGLFYGYIYYGINQVEVQRLLSMGNIQRAKRTILNALGAVFAALVSFYILGLMMYAIFYDCDPISDANNTGLISYDQVVPYFIASRFGTYPGLTGFCIAGIFSGSLSSVSSMLNSLTTVTLMDFIKPLIPSSRVNDSLLVVIAKGLSFTYGFIGIGLSFAVAKFSSIFHIANVFLACIDGPIGAMFSMGVLSRKTSQKSALIGLVVGLTSSCWIGYGSLLGGYTEPSYPFSTSGCDNTNTSTYTTMQEKCIGNCSNTVTSLPKGESEISVFYKVSYMWLRTIGISTCLVSIFIADILSGWKDILPQNSKCLSPLVRRGNEFSDVIKNKCPSPQQTPVEIVSFVHL